MSTSDKLTALNTFLAIIGICIAVLAALLPIYFQFLRKTKTLKLTLLGCNVASASEPEPAIIIDLAFANSGNQQATLLKVRLRFEGGQSNSATLRAQDDSARRLEPSSSQCESYKFVCPASFFSRILEQDSSRRLIESIIYLEILDSSGNRHVRNIRGCMIKVENFRICGTSYPLNAQVTLLS